MKVLLPALLLSVALDQAAAQSVRITANETGQGYMIKEDGNCWVLMPKHLLNSTALVHSIEVETSPAPSLRGEGRAYPEFWDGMDFALGIVGQKAGAAACTAGLETITQTRIVAGRVLRGELRVVQEGGGLLQYPMRITDTLDHKTFVAEYTDPGVFAEQGRSG